MNNYLELLVNHKKYMRDVLSKISLGDMRENDEFVSSLYHTEDYLIGKLLKDKNKKNVDEILVEVERHIKEKFGITKTEFINKALNYLGVDVY